MKQISQRFPVDQQSNEQTTGCILTFDSPATSSTMWSIRRIPKDCPNIQLDANQSIHRTWHYTGPNGHKYEYTGTLVEISGTFIVVRTQQMGLEQLPITSLRSRDLIIVSPCCRYLIVELD